MPKLNVQVKNVPVRYNGVTHSANAEFTVDESDLKSMEQLVMVLGYVDQEVKPLEKMTVPELIGIAFLNKIDLGGAKLKPEIIEVILKAGAKDDLGAKS